VEVKRIQFASFFFVQDSIDCFFWRRGGFNSFADGGGVNILVFKKREEWQKEKGIYLRVSAGLLDVYGKNCEYFLGTVNLND
jgi:hypothetical protein